jgi:hypothetical protein
MDTDFSVQHPDQTDKQGMDKISVGPHLTSLSLGTPDLRRRAWTEIV